MRTRKAYVVYWNNVPNPYIIERFNAVVDRGAFDFEAWFTRPTEAGLSWELDEREWRFAHRYMPSLTIAGRRFHLPLPALQRRPDVLVSLYAEPAFLAGWAASKLRGAKTAFWCQVTMDRWVERKSWKEAVKRFVFPRVDATLGSGEDSRAFAMRYGTPPDKALRLRHSIDVDHYSNGSRLDSAERDKLRNELGVKGVAFIYVGRLWWGKGVNYLLEAFAAAQSRSHAELSLLLVGNGPEEAALRKTCAERGIRNVIFTGFIQKPFLPRYYALADVFVFPTLGDPYGLVVDEAMAARLPVVSTAAAGEIRERVEEGVNGYVVPPEDSVALADRMGRLAGDAALRQRMGLASAEKVAGHTPQRWAEDFENIVSKLLAGTAP